MLKSTMLTHVFAAITVAFGIWLVFSAGDEPASQSENRSLSTSKTLPGGTSKDNGTSVLIENYQAPKREQSPVNITPSQSASLPNSRPEQVSRPVVQDPEKMVNEYIAALRNSDTLAEATFWSTISQCEACLQLLVEMIVDNRLENDLMLKLATKMTELDSNIVLPVFDVMIDPARNRNQAIVLSEKLMKNGRPAFVAKLFQVIYRAQENGYQDFASQLTWVVTKLDNQAGVEPILDIITGRSPAAVNYGKHVSSIFSKVVYNIPEPDKVAQLMADYYATANPQEQDQLWQVISRHPDTLVLLALDAEQNGQLHPIQKLARSIAQLPNEQAVDGLMKLHIGIEYAPEYLKTLLTENVKLNPTVRKLHKLEDYMRDPGIDLESRFVAAEGLLAVRDNRHARYILEKVIKNTQYADPELQAYIGGRL